MKIIIEISDEDGTIRTFKLPPGKRSSWRDSSHIRRERVIRPPKRSRGWLETLALMLLGLLPFLFFLWIIT